ncbi:DNA gyrase inhibitor YacG [Sphingomonas donggukensis]|uniref:DNA gyrase inhibitor YacG n=1 Tax=Sphingomonas donggukensis TaxID=2949093 RepID=A0ABY4TQ33_9SPHN|nr:DNA gyrase inhibitor YacG [Sphingomonas donggukensis]URW74504.1 DNA gyrase inhibitor YacG [Sphingomonas donggukensis]
MSRPATRNLCPLCRAPAQAPHAPFCSQGCRDRDLLQWLGEGYRIPGPAADPFGDPGLDSPGTPD